MNNTHPASQEDARACGEQNPNYPADAIDNEYRQEFIEGQLDYWHGKGVDDAIDGNPYLKHHNPDTQDAYLAGRRSATPDGDM